jgi:hypothetical protein
MNSIPVLKRNTCSTCAFKGGGGNELYCRFNPPTVHPAFTMTASGPKLAGQVALFPKVDPTWWCGQFSAAPVFASEAVVSNPDVVTQ